VNQIAEASKKPPPFENATQGQVLDFEASNPYHRDKSDGEPLTGEQLKGLMHDGGKTLEDIQRKYGLVAAS